MNNCMDCKYRRSTLTTSGYEHECLADGEEHPKIIDDPNEPFDGGCYAYEQLQLTEDTIEVKRTKLIDNAFRLICETVSTETKGSIDYKYGHIEGIVYATMLLLYGDEVIE